MNEVYWPTPKVVVLEASYPTRYLISQLLTPQGIEVHQAGSLNELRQTPVGDMADCADCKENILMFVVGRRLPDGDGYDFVKWLRQTAKWNRTPIIVLDQLDDKQRLLEALQMGATDYLAKPFRESDFLDRVLRLIPADKLAPGEKLPSIVQNLFTVLSKEVSRAERTGLPLSIILTDVLLDSRCAKSLTTKETGLFRRAIEETFRAATETLREIDSVVPYGGKSFAAILPHTGPEGRMKAEERLSAECQAVANKYTSLGNLKINILTASASYPAESKDWHTLLEAARTLLQKKLNKEDLKVVLASEGTASAVQEKGEEEPGLRAA